MDKTSVIC